MGTYTDWRIANWQAQVGLTLPSIEKRRIYTELADRAVDLIKILELEKSGIRDGNGAWHGSDPVRGVMQNLIDLIIQSEGIDVIDMPYREAKAALAGAGQNEEAADDAA